MEIKEALQIINVEKKNDDAQLVPFLNSLIDLGLWDVFQKSLDFTDPNFDSLEFFGDKIIEVLSAYAILNMFYFEAEEDTFKSYLYNSDDKEFERKVSTRPEYTECKKERDKYYIEADDKKYNELYLCKYYYQWRRKYTSNSTFFRII